MVTFLKKHEGGYVGLVALLIVVAFASIFLVTTLRRSLGPLPNSDGIATSTGQNAIQAAENAKKLLENPDRF